MTTRAPNCRHPVAAAVLASALAATAPPRAHAVIFYSTGDPTYNTTAPVGSLANTPWQYEGNWQDCTGTAIAPQYFITANHVGGGVGNTFTFSNGTTYTTIPFPDGSPNQRITTMSNGAEVATDLVVYRIAGTFPTFAPLYNALTDGPETSTATAANPAVIIGRGTQRGTPVTLNGNLRGWQWASSQDGVRRWGTNVITQIDAVVNDGHSIGKALKFTFDANPADRAGASSAGYSGVNEATMSAGDSGGGVFIKTPSGKWKLAGVNWAVIAGFTTTPGGTGPNQAIFDAGGFYQNGSSTQITDSSTDVPAPAYSSQISASFDAINAVIGNTYAWNVEASGSWATASNWWNATSTSAPASAPGSEIVFGSVATGSRTVTLNSNKIVGNLIFDGPGSYTIDGSPTLTLESSVPNDPATAASITVYSGTHTIAAPLTLNKSTTFTMAQASASLSVTGAFTPAAGTTITKAGPGSLVFPTLRTTAPVLINAGTLQIAPNGTTAGTARLNALTITGGKLDLTNNDLVLDYSGTTPADTLRQYLLTGRNGGAWNGSGIVSSTAAADPQQRTAIAVTEASTLLGLSGSATTSWSGQTVDATSLLLKYTWYGDANLDGKVTADDYTLLDRGLAKGLTGWVNGDFNYDNVINAADYALIDRAYAAQSGTLSPDLLAAREAQFGTDYVVALFAAVPEPSSGALLAAGAIPLLRRRHPRR